MSGSLSVRELVYETTPALIVVFIGVAGIVASLAVAGTAETYPVAAPAVAKALSNGGWLFFTGGGLLGIAAAAWWIHDEGEHRARDGRHAS
ncbi:hypothetical protein LG293_17650 (plasmid) [Citricoccus nitrophenolicus]